ncbi:MAG: Gfo/Idh/MocA family oxidoreductase [Eubacteriales bacterium]|nr:Gfo/Idh/MocA family oxidoreductase [Eubacteriales bacterium]
MKRPVKIGIAGIGRAGWAMHCKELENMKDKFNIVAACDLIPERRQKMAERYGCKVYDNIRDLIADPEVELADIATRSADHMEHALMALEAGKDVFLEKPACLNYSQAMRLRSADTSSAGRLYIRHNRRFDPDFLHIREIIASGILGNVYEIKLARHSYGRRDDWQTLMKFGGGQMLNWGPHIVDHALRFLESPVKDIFSDLKQIAAAGDAEDHLKIVLRAENGRVADLEISGGVAIPGPLYQIFGTKGSLVSDGKKIRLKYLDPETILPAREAFPGTLLDGAFSTKDVLVWKEEEIAVDPAVKINIWDELYKALRENSVFPISLDEAFEVIRVITEAKKGTRFEQ